MNFQIYPSTVRINSQINEFKYELRIIKIFRYAVEYVKIFEGMVELTLFFFVTCAMYYYYYLGAWVRERERGRQLA